MNLLFDDHTYELSDDPEDNWIYHAWEGLLHLKILIQRETGRCVGKEVDTFATIGTGPGLDGLLAASLLQPRRVVMTDIQASAKHIAYENFLRNAKCRLDGEGIQFCALEGSLCEPLRHNNIQPDVIYMNLPNIPGGDIDSVLEGMRSSTFVAEDAIEGVPDAYKKYLLGMQYIALHDAVNTVSDNGSSVLNLGGRVPLDIVQYLFHESGLDYCELTTSFKRQTQPEEVVTGYRDAEDHEGVTFDFYDYKHAQKLVPRTKSGLPDTACTTAEDWKAALQPAHLTSGQAYEHWKNGSDVGHLVQLIRGTKRQK